MRQQKAGRAGALLMVIFLLCTLLAGCGAKAEKTLSMQGAVMPGPGGFNMDFSNVVAGEEELYFVSYSALWHATDKKLERVGGGVYSIAGNDDDGLFLVINDPEAPLPVGPQATLQLQASLVKWSFATKENETLLAGVQNAVLLADGRALCAETDEQGAISLQLRTLGSEDAPTTLLQKAEVQSEMEGTQPAYRVAFCVGEEGILVQLCASGGFGDEYRYLLVDAAGAIAGDTAKASLVFGGRQYEGGYASSEGFEINCGSYNVTQHGSSYVRVATGEEEVVVADCEYVWATDHSGRFYAATANKEWQVYDGSATTPLALPDAKMQTINAANAANGKDLYFVGRHIGKTDPHRVGLFFCEAGTGKMETIFVATGTEPGNGDYNFWPQVFCAGGFVVATKGSYRYGDEMFVYHAASGTLLTAEAESWAVSSTP